MYKLVEIVKRTHSTYAENADNTGLRGLIGAMGLATEGAEVLDLFKKAIEQDKQLDPAKLREELADVLYYLTLMCIENGLIFEDLEDTLVIKLSKRFPNGFNKQDAEARVDVAPEDK